MQLTIFTSAEKLAAAFNECTSEDEKRDLLSLRNSLLLYKALSRERHREVFFSLEAFDGFEKTYRHFLLGSDF
mgnify:CR=1 FL=1